LVLVWTSQTIAKRADTSQDLPQLGLQECGHAVVRRSSTDRQTHAIVRGSCLCKPRDSSLDSRQVTGARGAAAVHVQMLISMFFARTWHSWTQHTSETHFSIDVRSAMPQFGVMHLARMCTVSPVVSISSMCIVQKNGKRCDNRKLLVTAETAQQAGETSYFEESQLTEQRPRFSQPIMCDSTI